MLQELHALLSVSFLMERLACPSTALLISPMAPKGDTRSQEGQKVLSDRQLAEVAAADNTGTGQLPATTATCSHRIMLQIKELRRQR